MQIRTLIIDDEPLARQRIENLLNDLQEIVIVDQCKKGSEAVTKIKEYSPELIFLDIELKDMTGFDVLHRLDPASRPLVIFVTAYDEFALKAFDYFAFDYLLKPFKDERFYGTVKKVINHFSRDNASIFYKKMDELLTFVKGSNTLETEKLYKYKLPIKLGNKVTFINTEEIRYITASGYYAEIYTETKKHLLREPLTNLIEDLDSSIFIRIHRSTIINMKFIKELISSNYGEMDVKMLDNKVFRISKSYKKEFSIKMGV